MIPCGCSDCFAEIDVDLASSLASRLLQSYSN